MPVDYLVLTALDREWDAAFPLLANEHQSVRGDLTATYYAWRFDIRRPHKETESYLIAGAPIAMWTPAQTVAGIFASQSLSLWQPSRVILMGIAGSLEPDLIQLGDVVVSSAVRGYSVSSVDHDGFHFRPTVHQAGALDLDRVRAFKRSEAFSVWQEDCRNAADSLELDLGPRLPQLHLGETASGNSVVRSKKFVRTLRKQLGPYICAVEMEADGLYHAVRLDGNRADAMMIRGISDYADEGKTSLDASTGQQWQRYATANAARLLRALWQEVPFSPSSPPFKLNMQRGEPSRFRQEIVENGVRRRITDIRDSRQAGSQNLCFPSLLDRPGVVTPATTITVDARTPDGNSPARMRGLCLLRAPVVREITAAVSPGGLLSFDLPPSDRGLHAELFLNCSQTCAKLTITCCDQFGRSDQGSVTFG